MPVFGAPPWNMDSMFAEASDTSSWVGVDPDSSLTGVPSVFSCPKEGLLPVAI